jgi:thiamine-monophosphate kinase
MSQRSTLGEEGLISALRVGMTRFPGQLNGAFESDSELLDLGGGELMAITIDTLNSGSELALAPTPYEQGWLTTTVSLSDLAAVGARPVAVLLSCCLPAWHWNERDAQDYGRGASDAARAHAAYVVGGDMNWAGEESFTSCALGLVARDRRIDRLGAAPGHALYVTGSVGAGNANGFRNMVAAAAETPMWLPEARCAAASPLVEYAHACIDTSDGLLSAATTLAEVNKVGVEILDRSEIYHPAARDVADANGLPRWLLAAGEWGEYELLYAVRSGADERRCSNALAERGMTAVRVGDVTTGREVVLRHTNGGRRDIPGLLRRLRSVRADSDLADVLRRLIAEDAEVPNGQT